MENFEVRILKLYTGENVVCVYLGDDGNDNVKIAYPIQVNLVPYHEEDDEGDVNVRSSAQYIPYIPICADQHLYMPRKDIRFVKPIVEDFMDLYEVLLDNFFEVDDYKKVDYDDLFSLESQTANLLKMDIETTKKRKLH